METGDEAPDFSIPDGEGKAVALREFRGKKVVLYFYPKDDTPGCTIEAVDFTKLKAEFQKANTVILGISKDSCESHVKFSKKFGLTVLLLSDSDASVQKMYGVWRPKKFMGKEFLGTARVTFLIDEKGKIVKTWDPVKPEGHAAEVLEEIRKMK
ncbi:MAG TPA: thioredoxin-dependent thiol peroxidase [Candidatus Bilamarchaeum sp.]|nr:thioredoxin-dependent thiol peroxidase [Candidatus Bilamarchaeum sp.]